MKGRSDGEAYNITIAIADLLMKVIDMLLITPAPALTRMYLIELVLLEVDYSGPVCPTLSEDYDRVDEDEGLLLNPNLVLLSKEDNAHVLIVGQQLRIIILDFRQKENPFHDIYGA